MPGYHGRLYNLTDDAIRACPPDTRWLMVTNGDNRYDAGAMAAVAAAPADSDVVALDYYSR